MDNLPRQTTDGKLISPYLWARSDANRFFAAMAKYDRDAEPETDERSAADEAYAGLVIAENLITRYGTAEERIERGYQKAMAALKPQARVLLTVQKRDVIAEREALKKAERAAQPKTEWIEELDEATA